MGRLVMGYWDCPYCDTKGIRGDMAACPGCGRPRGEVKFYMKGHGENAVLNENERDDVEYIDDKKAETINRNADWYCSFCNTLNSDDLTSCRACGASRAESEKNYFDMRREQEARQSQSAPVPVKRSKRPLTILIVAIVALVGIFMYMNGSKTSAGLRVSAVNWQRSVQIEENTLMHESDWTLPQGAEQTDARREIHHYENVVDHYENVPVERSRRVLDHYETEYSYVDKGNGYYEEVTHRVPVYTTEYYTEYVRQPVYRQEARYQTKYYYDIWRWVATRIVRSEGTDHAPYWPDPGLGEREREGDRDEKYTFTVTDKDGRTTTYRLAQSVWEGLDVGQEVSITSRRSGAEPYLTDASGNRIADIYLDR